MTNQNTLQSRREAIVNAHIEAETQRHDVAATLATFRHPRYEVPALGLVADGAEAVSGLVGGVFAAFPDFFLHKSATYHSENAVIVECIFGGTQQGEWTGIPPSGRKAEVQAALIFVFDGEDLVCEKVYYDNATVVRQLTYG